MSPRRRSPIPEKELWTCPRSTGPTGHAARDDEPGAARARTVAGGAALAWQLVAVRAGALDPAEVPDPAPVDPATAARATTMLIARLARRDAGGVPVEEWAPDLLAWLLGGATQAADDGGVPLAVAVFIAAALGHELPGWIDRHGGAASADLPALTDVCWALAYAPDATHHRPGLADIAVADLLHPRAE